MLDSRSQRSHVVLPGSYIEDAVQGAECDNVSKLTQFPRNFLTILPLPILFLLNGIGYLTLVTALYLPALSRFQPIIRWLLIGFAALTIIMYFVVSGFVPNPIGLIDKAVEIVLIALLLIEARKTTRATGPARQLEASGVEGVS